jgi:hypothetical protein
MMKLDEIWKDIVGYEGLYKVSNLGNVRSVDRFFYNKGNIGCNKFSFRKGKVLKPSFVSRNRNYKGVVLHKDGEAKSFTVHRLVAEAFIPNPKNLPQVNHKDENTLNNCVGNLEWCDCIYNINYGTGMERRKRSKTNNAYNQKSVICLDTGIKYANSYDAQRKTGVYARSIRNNCSGRYKSAGGFKWMWCENNKVSQKALEKFNDLLDGEE